VSSSATERDDEVGLDEELAELPPPPRTTRSAALVLMVLTVLLAGALAWSLMPEARYALQKMGAPVDLGSFATAKLGPQSAGRFVRAHVSIGKAKTVDFKRVGESDGYRIALVSGGNEPRFVEFRVATSLAGPRFVPPSLAAGRLVRIADLGARHRGLADALDKLAAPSASGWLLLDGDNPDSVAWVLGLELLLLVFALWCVAGIFRIVRKRADG